MIITANVRDVAGNGPPKRLVSLELVRSAKVIIGLK